MLRAFFEAAPIDVYSSAEWSSIIALTTASLKERGGLRISPSFGGLTGVEPLKLWLLRH